MDRKERTARSLEALKQYASEIGHWPSSTEWNSYALGRFLSVSSITRNTKKTWEELREEFGFPPRFKKFSKEEMLDALRRAAGDMDGHLTLAAYKRWQKANPGAPTQGMIERAFGSFNAAKKEAGLAILKPYRKKYTLEEVEQALLDCAKDLGGLFSNMDYERWVRRQAKKGKQYPSISVVLNMASPLPETKRRLGIPTHERYHAREEVSLDEVEAALKEFVSEQLQPVKYRKWSTERGKPVMTTLDKYGGYKSLLVKILEKYTKEELQKI